MTVDLPPIEAEVVSDWRDAMTPRSGGAVAVIKSDDAQLVELDQLIDAEDAKQAGAFRVATLARWHFGRKVLAEKIANGGKQLPHGRMAALCEKTGKTDREIQYRVKFAECYTSEDEVRNAFRTFSSWRQIVQSFAPPKPDPAPAPDPVPPAPAPRWEPQPSPDPPPRPDPLPAPPKREPTPNETILELFKQADTAIHKYTFLRRLTEAEKNNAIRCLNELETKIQKVRASL